QFRFTQALDVEVLERSIQRIINRHEVLRTVYKEQEDQVYQLIQATNNWSLKVVSSKAINKEALIEQTINAPFDLSADHMIRGVLFAEEYGSYLLVLVLHHIATDGWSQNQLIRELVELYDAQINNREANLPELAIQYSDYAIWQRSHLSGDHLSEKLGYWKEKLAGVESLNLPLDYTRPAIQSHRGDGLGFHLSKELTGALRELCQQEEVTLFMLLLSGFKVLLYKYSGQTDICVGSPMANRREGELKNLIGFFVNSIALRSDLSDNPRFLDLLQSLKSTTLSAYQHQDAPFEKVVEEVVDSRELSSSPIFQVMFTLQNVLEEIKQGASEQEGLLNLQTNNSSGGKRLYKISKYDLTVGIQEHGEELIVDIEYCIDLFKEETIRYMGQHYLAILESIVKAPAERIDDITLLNKTEREQLLVGFNDTKFSYPNDESIGAQFKKQVAKRANATALIFEGKTMTYQALEEQSNQLAWHLIHIGVQP
ncbi:MAG: condensation domain-containing protein, partial [Bacteroidota bacterium]